MRRMNAWQAIVNALKIEGIEYVFGLPGGDLFYDALYDVPEVKPILVREESSGVFMAMAYARMTGKPGVCYASSGPGVANLVPGIMEAESACVPVIAIGGASSTANAGMGAFQEADQIGIMKPITRWTEHITSPERVHWVVRRAFSFAANGKPGPVFIEVPKDSGAVEGEVPDYAPSVYPLRSSGDPSMIAAAAKLLMEAQRPLIIAGGGAVYSQAFKQVRELAENLDTPVMTTPCGRGILPEDHPLAFGLVGLYFSRLGEQVYSEADLLITIGSRNEDFQSGRQRFFPEEAKYIQIDIDPHEIGRNWIPDVPIVGDAGMILKDLIDRVKKRKNAWTQNLLKLKEDHEAEVKAECMTDEVPIKTRRVVRELNQVFGKDTILVNENGSQDLWSYYHPYYKVLDINCCIAPGEQTCMGFGVAGAIGAKLAQPSKKVVCTTGDGAFQMFMKELPTAVQYNAPVTYIVLNNFGLGWIRFGQRQRGDRFIATDFTAQPDFVKIAEANGCYGERVEIPANIKPALERALKANQGGKPAVVEFIVDGWDFAPGFKNF
mgnify:CR=1 FL=1